MRVPGLLLALATALWSRGVAQMVGGAALSRSSPAECHRSETVLTGFRHEKPFRMPAESIVAGVHVVAVVPTQLPRDLSQLTRIRATNLDSFVERELRRRNWTLVPGNVSDSVLHRAADSVGALYDPVTGQPDSLKVRARHMQFVQGMVAAYHPDAFLWPSVQVVVANFSHGTAEWDGARQGYQSFGKRLLSLGGGDYGRAPALSLLVQLYDPDDRLLYSSWGGIQLLSIPGGGKFNDVPDSLLFADTARSAEAVSIALCPLVQTSGAQ